MRFLKDHPILLFFVAVFVASFSVFFQATTEISIACKESGIITSIERVENDRTLFVVNSDVKIEKDVGNLSVGDSFCIHSETTETNIFGSDITVIKY